jgi:hypothetical protein
MLIVTSLRKSFDKHFYGHCEKFQSSSNVYIVLYLIVDLLISNYEPIKIHVFRSMIFNQLQVKCVKIGVDYISLQLLCAWMKVI